MNTSPLSRAAILVSLGAFGCASHPAIDAAGDVPDAIEASSDVASDITLDTTTPRYDMPACSGPATSNVPLATRCQHFVDAQGRVVILHGINARIDGVFDVTFSDGRLPLEPIPTFTIDDARRMRALGFNFIRLPVNWSGLEPTDTGSTQLDAAYLARVHAVVDIARQVGLLVLVDLHEDAWSKEIGEDGAPLWAIQPPPTMLLGGPLQDLGALRGTAQVLNAFATFFSDPDVGARLRTRFGSMAAQLASSFHGDNTVFGFELFNEPIAGPADILRFSTDTATAVRAADSQHLIAFEPSAARNLLDRAPIADAPFAVMGSVYAPHIYTLSLNGSDTARMTMTRDVLRPSMAAAVREATSWHTPMLITEWGYGPTGIRAADYFAYEEDLHDEFGLSAAFWVWKERSQGGWGFFDYDAASDTWTERATMRQAFERVMPEAIAGWPHSYGYDRVMRRFELRYAGDASITAPTRIYVPAPEDFTAMYDVTCDGMPVTAPRDAATGLVDVGCSGAGEHVVVIAAR